MDGWMDSHAVSTLHSFLRQTDQMPTRAIVLGLRVKGKTQEFRKEAKKLSNLNLH
jgi:hypothetical protein